MSKPTGIGRGNNPNSHGHHKSGPSHHRWAENKIISSHGYVKTRVGRDHPLADPNGYAYEHLVVWTSAGMRRPGPDEVLHHRDGNKQNNQIGNLEVLHRVEHAAHHQRMLSDAQVADIRKRYTSGEFGTRLAVEYGVPSSRVYRILHGYSRCSAGGPISTASLRGKKAASRLLDGREHNDIPEVLR